MKLKKAQEGLVWQLALVTVLPYAFHLPTLKIRELCLLLLTSTRNVEVLPVRITATGTQKCDQISAFHI